MRTPLGLSIFPVIRKRDLYRIHKDPPRSGCARDGATGLLWCTSFLKHRQLSKQINRRRDQQAYFCSNVKMARLLHNLLLLTVSLTLKIRVMGYWSLIYGYCALCTGVALLKLGWNIILRPSTTFQWTVRETPPACLNDTSLGTHCYVRIKVRHLVRKWMHDSMKECLHKHNFALRCFSQDFFFFFYCSNVTLA